MHLIDLLRRIGLPADGFEGLRSWFRTSRLATSADGIIVVTLLGIALVLGVLTATAAIRRSSADAAPGLATIGSGDTSGDVVTKTEVVTVTTSGKAKRIKVERTRVRTRVVKRPGGTSTLFESVAGPTKTVTGPTKTVREVVTETVTNVLTVTETVDDGGGPGPGG